MRLFLSTDTTLDASDKVLTTVTKSLTIKSGKSSKFTVKLSKFPSLPAGSLPTFRRIRNREPGPPGAYTDCRQAEGR